MTTNAAARPLSLGVVARSFAARWALAHRWTLCVWTGMVAWTVVLFAIVRNEFVEFRLGRFDLGNMVQVVWSTAHGRALEQTTVAGEQLSRLGTHVDPILVLFAPLWLVAPTPLALFAVRTVALALGALPVFWLGKRYLSSEKAAALLALAYLAYPWVDWMALDSFHPVTLAVPLFLFGIWYLETDRVWAFACCAVLIAATGELMGLSIAALGLWYAFARRRVKPGLGIALLGTAWTVLALYVVVPAFSDGPSVFYGYYSSIGGSPQGVLRTAVTDPGAIVSALISSRDLAYVLLLAAPLAGLFLLAPGIAAIAVPQLLANGLSDVDAMTQPRHHYVAAALPFLVVGVVLGVARIAEKRQVLAASAALALSLAFTALAGPWPGSPGNTPTWDTVAVPAQHADALRAAVALVPDDAALSTTNKAGSHLAARRYLYSVPIVGRADWIVLDTKDPFVEDPHFPVLKNSPAVLASFRRRIERDANWSKVFARDGVLVFRR